MVVEELKHATQPVAQHLSAPEPQQVLQAVLQPAFVWVKRAFVDVNNVGKVAKPGALTMPKHNGGDADLRVGLEADPNVLGGATAN